MAAVDLLQASSVLKKSDWPYYALGIQILKVKLKFSMNNHESPGSEKGQRH